MPANETVLSQVAREVFEQMVFLPLQSEFEEKAPGKFINTAITFGGQLEGTLVLKVPEKYVSRLFCSMLGMEDESSPVATPQALDAICELLNILGGNLLTRLTDSQASFDIGIPRVLPAAEMPSLFKAGVPPISVRMGLLEGWIELTLALRS